MNRIKAKYWGNKDLISEKQYELYQTENYHPMFDLIPVAVQLILLLGVTAAFPSVTERSPIYMPVCAALSALIMCLAQNKSNVLQSEQSKANKWGTLIFSVALSLYLGIFVSKEVAFYWICSNLMATVQMYILNWCISPKKSIDYSDLQNSREELDRVKAQAAAVKIERSKDLILREKADYKRFLQFENKQIVFYSEKNGFYKYFKDIIELILRKTDIIVHYISSDPNDEVFKLENEFFRTYYIDETFMVLMMRMEADIVVMTTPDLQNFYIKRSMVRDDIEYIYIDHGMGSLNLMLRPHALDNFDTIFVSNELNYQEIRAQEKFYGLNSKEIVKYGYSLIDNMASSYHDVKDGESSPSVLIAPSWQENNILDSCIEELLDSLLSGDNNVIVRPHPQYVRHWPERLDALEEKFRAFPNFSLQRDFSSNDTVFNADVLVTDWSGIAYEYSFTTLKPCLFIDTPMKVMNPDYQDLGIEPFDITIRNLIGISLNPSDCSNAAQAVEKLIHDNSFSKESIAALREKYLFNVGTSAKVGANYIIQRLIEKSKS